MRKNYALLILLSFLLSFQSFAADPGDVVINEIAWGGTAASSYDEWIELYNPTSSAIDLTNWKISATDGTPNITLNGTIPAKGFFLLERSDDNTVSDVAADQIYTGALGNAGENLQLLDNSSNVIDQVDFSTGWPAGTAAPDYYSMERIDPFTNGSDAGNWASNDGVTANGSDADGNPLNGTPKVRNSVTSLLIISHTPGKNELNVAINSNIQIQFSENIDAGTIDENTFNIDGSMTGMISGSFTVTNDVISFNPAADFKPGESISITLTTTIQSTNGSSLIEPYFWKFIATVSDGCGIFTSNGQSLNSNYSQDVALGDLDNDGDLDAFVANGSFQSNRVWINDGYGNFTISKQNIGSSNSRAVSLGDLDGDGDLDAFVANLYANHVYFNDGNANFTSSGQDIGNYESACGVALGDLDGDGDLDAFVAGYKVNKNKIWLNNGTGFFTDSGQNLGDTYNKDVSLGDLDNDGDLDAFIFKSDSNQVWLNDGNGNFTITEQRLGDAQSLGGCLGDIDNDGDLDVFVANYVTNNANKIWLNDGNGNFTDSGQNLGNSDSWEVFLADIDGDNDLDAFIVNNGPNTIWINDGAGNFTNSNQVFNNVESMGISVGDVDGDGDVDAYVANNGANKVYLNCIDFGDAPDPLSGKPGQYPTLLANNGARHNIVNDLYFGSAIDGEADGLQSSAANGDDVTGDDEDGIDPAQLEISEGMIPVIDVDVVNNTGDTAIVKGWIDYNSNGVFEAGESAVSTTSLSGVVSLTFPQVPAGTAAATFARFRISTDFNSLTGPGGFSINGEVEDYPATITLPPDIDATKDDTLVTDNDSDGFADPGDQIRYFIIVANTGDGEGRNVVFSDIPDTNTTLMVGSVTTSQGTVTSGNDAGDTMVEVNIGTLLSFTGADTVTFVVTVNSPLPANLTHICNQGIVSGSNFDDEITDDPDTTPYEDSTCTELDDDFDEDGIPNNEDGDGDRDGDGIPNNEDYDPSGWIYNEDNGEIVSGGTISISPSTGVTIIEDGSDGFYQFTVSQGGDYTLSYTPPTGFNLSSLCQAQSGTLDPDPSDPNPYVVGAGSKDGTNNQMTNWDCNDNPYYWNFHLEVNDPVIINNNIPLGPLPTNVVLSSFTATVEQNSILITWTTETEPDNAGFNLYRSTDENGEYAKINKFLIASQGDATSGANYTYLDTLEQAGNYFYKLQSVSLTGDTSFYGPVSVVLTEIALRKMTIPAEFSLRQNYPNPFNPETHIKYSLPEPADITISIYDVNGHLVRTLVSGEMVPGVHSVKWNGRDNNGKKVVSGVYFYHFKAVGAKKVFNQTNKMILMK